MLNLRRFALAKTEFAIDNHVFLPRQEAAREHLPGRITPGRIVTMRGTSAVPMASAFLGGQAKVVSPWTNLPAIDA